MIGISEFQLLPLLIGLWLIVLIGVVLLMAIGFERRKNNATTDRQEGSQGNAPRTGTH